MKWKKFEEKVMEKLNNLPEHQDSRIAYLYGMETILLYLRNCSIADKDINKVIWQLTDKIDEIKGTEEL